MVLLSLVFGRERIVRLIERLFNSSKEIVSEELYVPSREELTHQLPKKAAGLVESVVDATGEVLDAVTNEVEPEAKRFMQEIGESANSAQKKAEEVIGEITYEEPENEQVRDRRPRTAEQGEED